MTRENYRLIKEGSREKMAFELGLGEQAAGRFVVQHISISKKYQINMVLWDGTWHDWETGLV